VKKLLIILIAIIIFSNILIVNAENMNWQTALENLLIKFPTILDENARFEAGNGIVRPIDADGINVPCHYRFQDLDDDGIPEAIITFGHPESEWVYDKIYKLYGDTYEQIGQALFIFYKNTQGKLVAATISGYTINAIYFAEIKNKKLILNDFIDSKGNDHFNGIKYDNFSEWDGTFLWLATDADETLRLLPEIDCSDIVEAARNRVYNNPNPQTKDDIIKIIFISIFVAANIILLNYKKYFKIRLTKIL